MNDWHFPEAPVGPWRTIEAQGGPLDGDEVMAGADQRRMLWLATYDDPGATVHEYTITGDHAIYCGTTTLRDEGGTP